MINNQLAMVFPGQGSQSVGMLADIAAAYPIVKKTFDEASAVLNYDLWTLTQVGPATELDKTVHTQPALLAASYALWKILQSVHCKTPAILAGHSLGEYTALVCAQAFAFSDAIRLVAMRGQFMQEAVAEGAGAMAAIVGLEDNIVAELCNQATQSVNTLVSPANYNSIGQVVVAGHQAAVHRVVELAKENKAKLAVLIPVSVPSHCALMQPAAERLANFIADIPFNMPTIPVVNNVDAKPYDSISAIKSGLVKQLYQPVRWVETIQWFMQQGVDTVIECGPGKVLTGLNKRIDKRLNLLTTADLVSLQSLCHQ